MFADQAFDQRLSLANPPVRIAKGREPAEGGYGWIGIFGLVLAAVAIIEAILGFRVWVQLSGDPIHSQSSSFIYRAGGWLTSPFGRYETFQSGRSAGVLQFASLIAAEVYLVVGLVALITVYLLRSWMTPAWNLAWRPVAFALAGLRVGLAWLGDSAGFGLLRLVDGATTAWLAAIQPALKRGLADAAEYSKSQGPVVLRATTTWLATIQPAMKRSLADAAEYSKRQGPVVLREVAVQSRRGLERSAAFSEQGSAFVLEKSRAGLHDIVLPATENVRRNGPILLRKFVDVCRATASGLVRLAEMELGQLKVELQRLARDYATFRARNYHGQARHYRG